MPMSFVMSKNVAFIGENAKGAHGEIYKSYTSVISTHFVDQVQICIGNTQKEQKRKTRPSRPSTIFWRLIFHISLPGNGYFLQKKET